MPSRRTAIAALASLASLAAASAWARPAVWVSGEIPPVLWRGPHGPEGYAHELFKRLRQMTGLDAELQFYPWARAMRMVQAGEAQATLVIARSAEREAQYQWLFPVGKFRFALFTRTDDAAPSTDLAALQSRRVGFLRASISRQLLTSAGVTELVEGKDYSELLVLLHRQVVDAVIGPEPTLRKLAAGDARVRATALDAKRELFAAGGPALPDDLRQRLLAAYQRLVDTGFVAQLRKQHPGAFLDE